MAYTYKRNGDTIDIVDESGKVIKTLNMGGRSGIETGGFYGIGPNRTSIFNPDGFRSNNLFRRGTANEVKEAFYKWYSTGKIPSAAALNVSGAAYKNIMLDVKKLAELNGIDFDNYKLGDLPGIPNNDDEEIDPQEAAFNDYYRDLYSLEEGTMGRQTLDRMEGAYANAADQQVALADAQYQQQALQQASTVKAIADQVRAERMARLRSGMSEAQIANQDMQMMMANVNALNQNAQLMNQGRLEGQLAQRTARDDAYMEWMNQMNARGQNAAAMAASDASDSVQTAKRYGINAAKYGAGFTSPYGNVTGLDDK